MVEHWRWVKGGENVELQEGGELEVGMVGRVEHWLSVMERMYEEGGALEKIGQWRGWAYWRGWSIDGWSIAIGGRRSNNGGSDWMRV